MSSYATGRKRHRRTTTEEVVALVGQRGILSVEELALELDISTGSARRYADAGVARGQLIRDEYGPDGHPLLHTEWRYTTNEEARCTD